MFTVQSTRANKRSSRRRVSPLARCASPRIWCLQPERPWLPRWQELRRSRTCTRLSAGTGVTLTDKHAHKKYCYQAVHATVETIWRLVMVRLHASHMNFNTLYFGFWFFASEFLPESLETRRSAELQSLRPSLPPEAVRFATSCYGFYASLPDTFRSRHKHQNSCERVLRQGNLTNHWLHRLHAVTWLPGCQPITGAAAYDLLQFITHWLQTVPQ